jgi:hypothetical protein
MAEHPAAPQVCAQCNVSLGPRRVTIAERDTTSTAVSDWTFCAWERARELVIRFVRFGRDDD